MAVRFYSRDPLLLGYFTLEGTEAHHLIHVMRLGIGDEVTLFNGDGKQYRAVVISAAKRRVDLNVTKIESPDRELPFRLHVGSALPKGDRLDFLVEKLTELGVTEFTPLIAERSVVFARDSKVEKLRQAVIEASKQCGRNMLMEIHSPQKVTAWCVRENLPAGRWIAHPGGTPVADLDRIPDGLAIAIGPEGGFTEREVQLAANAGFLLVSLGPRLLRIETAAVALTACVNSLFDRAIRGPA